MRKYTGEKSTNLFAPPVSVRKGDLFDLDAVYDIKTDQNFYFLVKDKQRYPVTGTTYTKLNQNSTVL